MTSHATRKWGPDGSDPIPSIQDHELRLQKLEEILSFRAGNSIGKTRLTGQQVETILMDQAESPLKESDRPRIECYTIRGILPPPGPIVSFNGCLHPAQNKSGDSAAAEPAPGSDAEHPPEGYVLVPREGVQIIASDWIVWKFDRGPWGPLEPASIGERLHDGYHPCARPIPANEGDSRLAESGEEWQEAGVTPSMMWDVIQEMRKALDCDGTRTPVEHAEHVMENIDELRATVERLTAELDTTKRLLAESLIERDRLQIDHDERRSRIRAFNDVLREKLGDLR